MRFFVTMMAAILICLVSSCSTTVQNGNEADDAQVKFTSDWKSLKQYRCPEWFRDAKFGIYFHWGVYSVPAYETEWYSHHMYVKGHPINNYHVRTYGPLSEFGYKDFIPMFKAEKFDPDQWAELFVKAGARFAGPVAEHADGFAMWDSDLTNWDAVQMGPKRDLVGELEKAIRQKGLKFITTLHHQWLYAWYPTLDKNTDASDPAYAGLYGPPAPITAFGTSADIIDPLPDDAFCRRWFLRSKEVVDKYKPDLVWFDTKLYMIDDKYLTAFLAHYYNSASTWDREVVATYKKKDIPKGAAVLDLERARMSKQVSFPWLTDDSIDWDTWCHVQNPNYKPTNRLIDTLVDIVSKNGCLLLNITPKANGEIPLPVQQRLLEMGQWLSINGQAIYDTRPWKIYGEGPTQVVEGHLSEKKNKDNTSKDIRFTTKGDLLYAIALGWPDDGKCLIKSLSTRGPLTGKITSVQLLGHSGTIDWSRDGQGLLINLPNRKPCEHAFAFVIRSE